MLEIDSLEFHINSTRLFDCISKSFLPGKFYAITGANGAGKSTLLKLLTGILTPSSGTIFWNKLNLLSQPRKEISRTVALVPPPGQPAFDFTVTEIVIMGGYSLSRPLTESEVRYVLELVDLWHLKDRSIAQLSSGEKQRVYIARALLINSPILLLDEPTANLDREHQQMIWNLLVEIRQPGKLLIAASHDHLAVEKYCDEVLLLQHGRLTNASIE